MRIALGGRAHEPAAPSAALAPDRGRRARGSRIARARPVLWAAVAGAVVVFAVAHAHEVVAAARLLEHVRLGWVGLAAAAKATSMLAFALVQRQLLQATGVRLRRHAIVEITLAGSALSMILPGGATWAGLWAYRQLRQQGVGRVPAAWVLLAAGALSSFALFVLVVAGIEAAGARGPVASLRWLAGALAAVPVAAGLAWMLRHRFAHLGGRARTGSRCADAGTRAGRRGRLSLRGLWSQVRTVRPGLSGWATAWGWAVANWVWDAIVLVASIVALGGVVPWRGILVAYGLTQIATSLAVTPGGIGVVEASLAGLLVAYGMRGSTALATVVLYRLVSFWIVAAMGGGARLRLRHARRRQPPPRTQPAVAGARTTAVGRLPAPRTQQLVDAAWPDLDSRLPAPRTQPSPTWGSWGSRRTGDTVAAVDFTALPVRSLACASPARPAPDGESEHQPTRR